MHDTTTSKSQIQPPKKQRCPLPPFFRFLPAESQTVSQPSIIRLHSGRRCCERSHNLEIAAQQKTSSNNMKSFKIVVALLFLLSLFAQGEGQYLRRQLHKGHHGRSGSHDHDSHHHGDRDSRNSSKSKGSKSKKSKGSKSKKSKGSKSKKSKGGHHSRSHKGDSHKSSESSSSVDSSSESSSSVDSLSESASLAFFEEAEAEANFGSSDDYEETGEDETPAQAMAIEMKEDLMDKAVAALEPALRAKEFEN
jgi:hypothetical protein